MRPGTGRVTGSVPFENLPPGLVRLDATDAGREWLAALPKLVEQCASRWSLRLGPPYAGSHVSLTLPAGLADGTDGVLKVQFPHRESEHEAEALRRWDGDGAIRLLDHDPIRHALLLERCRPGRPLAEVDADVAIAVLIGLLPRLWTPAGAPFALLSDESAGWAAALPRAWERTGRPFDRRMLDAALEHLAALSIAQGEQVLVHQDLHGANVLSAERLPWLVIDPKPLSGEREFSVAPIIRSPELGHDRVRVLGRLDRLTAELGLDRDRARRWAFAQTMAWAFENGRHLSSHIEVARWLLSSM